MTPPTASSARMLKFWLAYLDARLIRRHYCGRCRRPTVRLHGHVAFGPTIRQEWRS